MAKKPRYIDINQVKWESVNIPGVGKIFIPNIDKTPTGVVLCEDCIYTGEDNGRLTCELWCFVTEKYGFCFKGRRPMEGEIHGS